MLINIKLLLYMQKSSIGNSFAFLNLKCLESHSHLTIKQYVFRVVEVLYSVNRAGQNLITSTDNTALSKDGLLKYQRVAGSRPAVVPNTPL